MKGSLNNRRKILLPAYTSPLFSRGYIEERDRNARRMGSGETRQRIRGQKGKRERKKEINKAEKKGVGPPISIPRNSSLTPPFLT